MSRLAGERLANYLLVSHSLFLSEIKAVNKKMTGKCVNEFPCPQTLGNGRCRRALPISSVCEEEINPVSWNLIRLANRSSAHRLFPPEKSSNWPELHSAS